MRITLRVLLVVISLTISTNSATASDEHPINILVLGDSLSAAYGIPKDLGWVNLMRTELRGSAKVINASISGETTDGGRASLIRHLAQYEPSIVILELGANDGLRGFPLRTTKDNLQAMIDMSTDMGADVVLIGIHIPPNYGKRYTESFYQNFVELAEKNDLAFVPFLLDKVALDPTLMQSDQLHPTAEAQPIILENVLPAVRNVIDEHRSQ